MSIVLDTGTNNYLKFLSFDIHAHFVKNHTFSLLKRLLLDMLKVMTGKKVYTFLEHFMGHGLENWPTDQIWDAGSFLLAE